MIICILGIFFIILHDCIKKVINYKLLLCRENTATMPRPKKAVTDEQEPDAKYTAWILAAIAKVKGQKQRPNEDRIIHVLESTYGVDAQTVVEQLDLCVKAGRIIRGEFKGQSSYKDPSVTTPGSKRSPQMPSDLRKYVQKAILSEGKTPLGKVFSLFRFPHLNM